MLVADSGALLALYDSKDRHHRAVIDAVTAHDGPIFIPSAILAEVDYMIRTRLGVKAEGVFLDGIIKGAFTLSSFTLEDAAACKDLLSRYHDLDLGLADAAVIATADRLGIYRIITVDSRDFLAIRSKSGKPFELLPASSGRKRS